MGKGIVTCAGIESSHVRFLSLSLPLRVSCMCSIPPRPSILRVGSRGFFLSIVSFTCASNLSSNNHHLHRRPSRVPLTSAIENLANHHQPLPTKTFVVIYSSRILKRTLGRRLEHRKCRGELDNLFFSSIPRRPILVDQGAAILLLGTNI